MSSFTNTAPSPDAERILFTRAYEEARTTRRRNNLLFAAAFLIATFLSVEIGQVSLPKLIEGIPQLTSYIWRTLPELSFATFQVDLAEWYWNFGGWMKLLFDTIVIAFLATAIATIFGGVLSFCAARNLGAPPSVQFVARRVMEIARSVPELVFALIFVFAFGLGPLAGVLAIALHTTGALGKLFSEVNENADLGPSDGLRAAGANWPTMLRYAILPQVFPNFLSYILLRFEINVRSAAVIGFVGAGGIGQELYFVIRQFIYTDISAIVLLIVVFVAITDIVCERIRHHVIGMETLR